MLHRFWPFRRILAGVVATLAIGTLLQVTNTNPAVSQTPSLLAREMQSDPGTDPDSDAWRGIAAIDLPLTAQGGAYIAGGSVKTIRAQAGYFDGRLYVRVAWPDSTQDEHTTRAQDFADAVAIEFPASGKASIPSLCMGQANSAVNIWHWRADSNGNSHDPGAVYVNSLIDKQEASVTQFYTARDAGNPFANPDVGAVQTLSSVAFGELTTLETQDVAGLGKHASEQWAVVFARDFAASGSGHAAFTAGTTVDMAFAVWDGSRGERNGQKAVSPIATLRIAASGAGSTSGSGGGSGDALPLLMFVGFTALAIALAFTAARLDRRRS